MNTGLTSETEQAILHLAHAFDGYAYAKQVWYTPEEEIHPVLGQRMNCIKKQA